NRDARADTEKFDVRNFPQPAKQMVQFFIAEKQRVASAEQDISDRWGVANVSNLFVETRMKIVAAGITNQARTRAIAAIRRATIGNQEQHAIGVAMHQTCDR